MHETQSNDLGVWPAETIMFVCQLVKENRKRKRETLIYCMNVHQRAAVKWSVLLYLFYQLPKDLFVVILIIVKQRGQKLDLFYDDKR